MTDMDWNETHIDSFTRNVANRLGARAYGNTIDYNGRHIEFIHEITDLNNGVAYMKIDDDDAQPIDINDIDSIIEQIRWQNQ